VTRGGAGARGRLLAAVIGVALVAGHALAFPWLLARFARPDLIVTIDGASASPAPTLVGHPPPSLRPRLTIEDDGAPGPGLHHVRWSARYRGGFARAVGAVQLVGPFQDPAARTCTVRVAVGQRFLDDGHAGAGTVAHTVVAAITDQLRGYHQWAVGSFRRVRDVSVAWAQRGRRPGDAAILRARDGDGYVRATATLELDRVDVPITVLLVPALREGRLRFDVRVRARLDFGNRFANWVSDELDGDAFATRLAREQIGDDLIAALGPPPPLELGGGRTLRFDYCGTAPSVVDGAYASLPLAVVFGGPAGPDRVLPPALGTPHTPLAPPPPGGTITLDLELDALNAILFELWRTGYLDEELERAGLARRFDDDPAVQDLLSIRLSRLRLALPPVISARDGGGLRLAAEALVAIRDSAVARDDAGAGAATVTGRLWSGLDFTFQPGPAPSIGVAVALGPLELTCAPDPTTRVPCYADLVAALRDRAGDLHGALTDTVTRTLTAIFVGQRVSRDDVPAALEIRGVRVTSSPAPPGARIRLELDAAVAE
jgi:hypothetical protein